MILESFQYIDFNVINVNHVIIKSQSVVNLLGINIDFKLSFCCHIFKLCYKAGWMDVKCFRTIVIGIRIN